MRDKLYRFMQGRNGMDELARMQSWLVLILLLVGMFTRIGLFSFVALILMIYMYFRVFSRNTSKRYEENQKYLNIGDGQPLFSNEVKDLPKWNPQNEKMQEEIIQFFAAVTMDLRRTNEIQRQKINQQEKRIRQLEKRANEFVMFRDKAKHPFRTIWKKLFR